MDTRTILLIAAALWAAIAYAGDLWALVAWGWRAITGTARKATPATSPQAEPQNNSTIDQRVEAFQTVMPQLSASEATAVWARLEPIGPRIDSPQVTEPTP